MASGFGSSRASEKERLAHRPLCSSGFCRCSVRFFGTPAFFRPPRQSRTALYRVPAPSLAGKLYFPARGSSSMDRSMVFVLVICIIAILEPLQSRDSDGAVPRAQDNSPIATGSHNPLKLRPRRLRSQLCRKLEAGPSAQFSSPPDRPRPQFAPSPHHQSKRPPPQWPHDAFFRLQSVRLSSGHATRVSVHRLTSRPLPECSFQWYRSLSRIQAKGQTYGHSCCLSQ